MALALSALGACQTAAPTVSPIPSAAPTAAATTRSTAPATAEPSAGGVVELARSATALPAGRYTRAGFKPPITFAVEGGIWRAVSLLTDFFDIQHEPGTPDVIAVQFARPDGVHGAGTAAEKPASAAAAVEVLRSNAALVIVESSQSRMDGHVGSQVTVENPSTGTATASIIEVGAGTLGIDPGRRLWIAFFDTPDGLLAIMVGGSIAQWDGALLLAEPVLESVTIGE